MYTPRKLAEEEIENEPLLITDRITKGDSRKNYAIFFEPTVYEVQYCDCITHPQIFVKSF